MGSLAQGIGWATGPLLSHFLSDDVDTKQTYKMFSLSLFIY